jgi:hypothetical protein
LWIASGGSFGENKKVVDIQFLYRWNVDCISVSRIVKREVR